MKEVKRPVNLILDTDIGGDCDDACALALIHALCDRGEANLLAVTHCFTGPSYAGCIDAINTYCGHPDIPVGIFSPEAPLVKTGNDIYASQLKNKFPNAYQQDQLPEDSLRLIRRILAENKEPVTLIAIGTMYTMARLLESEPDEYSPLSGVELVKEKVERAVIMGGRFHETWPQPYVLCDGYVVDAEFNIIGDIPAAQTLCRLWPVELVFCSYEIGWDIITGKPMLQNGKDDNPMRLAYEIVTNGNGRESWDLATVLYAVRPHAQNWQPHAMGRITVDDRGITRWETAENGQHTYLLVKRDPQEIRKEIDDLLDAICLRHDEGLTRYIANVL